MNASWFFDFHNLRSLQVISNNRCLIAAISVLNGVSRTFNVPLFPHRLDAKLFPKKKKTFQWIDDIYFVKLGGWHS